MSKSKKKRKKTESKPKLTAAQRRAKRERNRNFMTIFINGKQKRVRRPQTIDGLPVEEYIVRNADPIWLHENGLWAEWHVLSPQSRGSKRTCQQSA